ncbi:hypothetical protein GCM10022263_30590 [Nocardioides daeguensis]|uniref:Uncharacterized protein n=1 Tax=Nocardioides daeguensis TaxID=908359 RepID=A0ABP6VUR3_9ACTN
MLVALTFGEFVSQHPPAGRVWPWTHRLWGRKFAWYLASDQPPGDAVRPGVHKAS